MHWLTKYDPDDGTPYGETCDCHIGEDHDGYGQLVGLSAPASEVNEEAAIGAAERKPDRHVRDMIAALRCVQAGWAFGVPETGRDQWLDQVAAVLGPNPPAPGHRPLRAILADVCKRDADVEALHTEYLAAAEALFGAMRVPWHVRGETEGAPR